MIHSRRIIENDTPANRENQKTEDGQNLNIDPLIDHPTFQDAVQSMVTSQKSDLTADSHAKGNQLLADPTETTNTENTNDTPRTLETKDQYNGNNTRRGNYNI